MLAFLVGSFCRCDSLLLCVRLECKPKKSPPGLIQNPVGSRERCRILIKAISLEQTLIGVHYTGDCSPCQQVRLKGRAATLPRLPIFLRAHSADPVFRAAAVSLQLTRKINASTPLPAAGLRQTATTAVCLQRICGISALIPRWIFAAAQSTGRRRPDLPAL